MSDGDAYFMSRFGLIPAGLGKVVAILSDGDGLPAVRAASRGAGCRLPAALPAALRWWRTDGRNRIGGINHNFLKQVVGACFTNTKDMTVV